LGYLSDFRDLARKGNLCVAVRFNVFNGLAGEIFGFRPALNRLALKAQPEGATATPVSFPRTDSTVGGNAALQLDSAFMKGAVF
jgi:hypothetical protein